MLILVLAGWCVGHIDNDIFSHPLLRAQAKQNHWKIIVSTQIYKQIYMQ